MVVEDWKCQLVLWWFFFPNGFGDGLRRGNPETRRVWNAWCGRLLHAHHLPGIELAAFARRMHEEGLARASSAATK